MTTNINPSNLTPPPANLPNGADASSIAAMQSLSAASQKRLLDAVELLVDSMKEKKGSHTPNAAASVHPAATVAAPAGNGDPTQSELITQAYADIAQIDSMYTAASGSGPLDILTLAEMLFFPQLMTGKYYSNAPGLIADLNNLLSKITDPAVKANINLVLKEIGTNPMQIPSTDQWRTFWNQNTVISGSLGDWLSNTDNSDALDTELTSPEDQMNLIQIMIDLGQKTSVTVSGKTIDDLFWKLNGSIDQTVVAFFMKNDGNWKDAQADITTFLSLLPAKQTATPNYNAFVDSLTKDAASAAWPYGTTTPDFILGDGVAFNDAWGEFRTGSSITDPSHITYGPTPPDSSKKRT